MKYKLKQGESKLVNGLWYNQGDEVELDDETKALPVEKVIPKQDKQKKEEG